MRLSRTVGIASLALILLASGCSGANNTTEDDPTTTDASPVSGPSADESPPSEAAGAPDPTATFRYGEPLPTTGLDPHRAPGAGDNTWLFPVYDRLVHLAPAGEPIPGLATEWEFSEDGLALTMTLREGVTFQDGEPFDAEAVKANIERGQTLEDSSVAGELENITEVEVADEHTVVLHLDAPQSTLPLVLSDRAGAQVSPAAFENDLTEEPVGAGLYRVESFEPSVSGVYVRNDDYWDQDLVAQAPARMEFTVIQDPLARLNAITSGEVDATYLDAVHVEDAEGAGITVDPKETFEFIHLQLDRTRSEFGDPLVRQAVNHAIDREAIVAGLIEGLGSPAVEPYPEDYLANSPDVGLDIYEYDPARAQELLAEAGLPDGFSFEMVTLNIESYVQLAEVLQAQLAEVGIDASIRQVPNVAVECYVDANCDSTPIIWTGRPDPLITAGLLYTSEGFANPGRHSTDEVDALYAEALAEVDPDARAELVQELSAQITRDALDVVVYRPFKNAAYVENVQGFTAWASGKPEFREVVVTE